MNWEELEVVGADNKPFVARVSHIEALLHEDHIGLDKLLRTSKHEGPQSFTFLKDQALDIKVVYKDSDRIPLVTPIIIDEDIYDRTTISEI